VIEAVAAKDILRTGLSRLGLQLVDQDTALARLVGYFQELRKWNRKVNLVAREAGDQEILEKHFLDSLTLLPWLGQGIAAQPASLLDIGTGAGFPGLVLKIACPDLAVTLVEPREKRVFFLRQVARLLGISAGLEILPVRLEPRAATSVLAGRTFRVVTSRAFSELRAFLELAAPYCAPQGRVICMKGPRAPEELAAWQAAAGDSPLKFIEQREWCLPFSGGTRILLVFGDRSAAGGSKRGGCSEMVNVHQCRRCAKEACEL